MSSNTAFFKNVRSVLLGGVGAQAISFGVMLLIVRLYSPAEVGEFYVWMSFLAVLEVLATGRYESAFFSIKNEIEAFSIAKLILYVGTSLSILTYLVLVILKGNSSLLPTPIPQFTLALALAMFGMGMNKAVLSVLAFLAEFNKLGFAKVILAGSIATAQVVAGVLAYGVEGLVYGQMVGVLLATFLCLLWLDRSWLSSVWQSETGKVTAALRTYINFPKFSLPADVINTLANQLPLILIASRFGAEAAGWFALTLKILGAPIGLLAASILDVFKSQAAHDFREEGNCRNIFLHTFRLLAVVAIVPFVLLWIYSEWLFSTLFGAEWAEAGRYAGILAPFFYCRFVVSPLSYTLYIAQKQQWDLLWQCGLLIISYLTFTLTDTPTLALTVYSIAYSLMYVIYFFISFSCARGKS